MAVNRLEREQVINARIEDVWRFFSNPGNLSVITPAYMKFIVTSGALPAEIHTGQIITYKISPLLGIPLSWETEITHVKPFQSFTDSQRKGPYRFWKHTHRFEEKNNKVLMTDIVEYELPLGIIGAAAHMLWIKRQLQGIFDYRFQKVEELFNNKKH